jgi:hypothetical protein
MSLDKYGNGNSQESKLLDIASVFQVREEKNQKKLPPEVSNPLPT